MNRDNNAVNDDVLFDDWATRDPAIYARAMRAHVFAFVVIGVLLLIGVIASFFFVYLLIVVLLPTLAFFCLLYEFLRIKNGHIQIYNDKIVIVNAFKNKKVIPYVKEECVPVWHIYAVRCDARDELEKYLKDLGIGTNKHYPIPMHLQECYKDLGLKEGDLPIAEHGCAVERIAKGHAVVHHAEGKVHLAIRSILLLQIEHQLAIRHTDERMLVGHHGCPLLHLALLLWLAQHLEATCHGCLSLEFEAHRRWCNHHVTLKAHTIFELLSIVDGKDNVLIGRKDRVGLSNNCLTHGQTACN